MMTERSWFSAKRNETQETECIQQDSVSLMADGSPKLFPYVFFHKKNMLNDLQIWYFK